nr:oligosaccharide flippase family protein [Alysiella crassa]UOP08014.1 oligosaccharide flippase family protein [Alysiella crassa]
MKLLKDSAIYLFGELFAKALPFLLLPYLTRKLGVAGFGELSYYQTILSLLALFFGFSQDGALTRYYYFYGKRNLANLMLTGYSYIALLACFGLIFAWAQNSLVLAAVVCAAATQSILATQLAWRQCQKRALAYTAIQTASGVFGSLLTILLLETTTNQPIAMRFAALVLANALVSMIAYRLVQKEKKRA